MKKVNYKDIAKNVINLEITALQKLKKSLNENFNKDFITAIITEINQKVKKNSNIKALQKLIIEQFIDFQKISLE